ncbi:hypothetical protein CIPAW_04G035800 [Carya illinoinensis]|uniref:Uncharacterized protein n=1 Tax=Carya illinoinensis TaxID=32201 RepID=A0A8T1QQD5_CARIL|nr:hypothetical protein CIPAW_04G035800 [Carya illinoinensis]
MKNLALRSAASTCVIALAIKPLHPLAPLARHRRHLAPLSYH